MKCEVCKRFISSPNQFHRCLTDIVIKDTDGNILSTLKARKIETGLLEAAKKSGIQHLDKKTIRAISLTAVVEFNKEATKNG